jgi:3-oxoacyl-[acyl-carrier-protein] synthase III
MPKGCFQNIVVKGIASAVPDNKRDTADWYETFGRENVEKFVKMTGVQSIFKSGEKQTASDLAFVAARKLLEKKTYPPRTSVLLCSSLKALITAFRQRRACCSTALDYRRIVSALM